MKFSILISAIILGIAALFGVQKHHKIQTLTTTLETLEAQALTLHIPTDPTTPFSSDRIRSENARAVRAEKIDKFSSELIAFFHKIKAAEKGGDEPSEEMQTEIAEIIGKLVELSPDELRLLVKAISADSSIDNQMKLELIGISTMMMASENPEAALAIALEARESLGAKSENDDHMLQMALMQYAAKDPVAAAQWLADNEEKMGPVEDYVKQRMIGAAAQQDIGIAIGLLETLKLNKESNAFDAIAQSVNNENADRFIAALRSSNATPEQRKNALRSLSRSELMKDFEAATTWLGKKEGLTTEERNTVTESLLYHNVNEQPDKWLTWLGTEDISEQTRKSSTQNIIAGWTQKDFAATGEWINQQPAGTQKNQAIQTYAATLALHEPAAAADWASALPQGPERTKLLNQIYPSYLKKDPEAAAAFAQKNGIKTDE